MIGWTRGQCYGGFDMANENPKKRLLLRLLADPEPPILRQVDRQFPTIDHSHVANCLVGQNHLTQVTALDFQKPDHNRDDNFLLAPSHLIWTEIAFSEGLKPHKTHLFVDPIHPMECFLGKLRHCRRIRSQDDNLSGVQNLGIPIEIAFHRVSQRNEQRSLDGRFFVQFQQEGSRRRTHHKKEKDDLSGAHSPGIRIEIASLEIPEIHGHNERLSFAQIQRRVENNKEHPSFEPIRPGGHQRGGPSHDDDYLNVPNPLILIEIVSLKSNKECQPFELIQPAENNHHHHQNQKDDYLVEQSPLIWTGIDSRQVRQRSHNRDLLSWDLETGPRASHLEDHPAVLHIQMADRPKVLPMDSLMGPEDSFPVAQDPWMVAYLNLHGEMVAYLFGVQVIPLRVGDFQHRRLSGRRMVLPVRAEETHLCVEPTPRAAVSTQITTQDSREIIVQCVHLGDLRHGLAPLTRRWCTVGNWMRWGRY